MTIGIAATGPGAGAAILRALATAETVGSGAIGGFVSFVAIAADGTLIRAETQRGGAATLFPGAEIPAAYATVSRAALMSSGPDRPEPLSQFTPADPTVGIVTGHRMPNTIGTTGININDAVLDLMRSGASPREAVERIVRENPGVDAGLIALSAAGQIFAADTKLVARLPDAGGTTLEVPGVAAVSVLHNAIRPHRALSLLVAEIALEAMVPPAVPDGEAILKAGVPLVPNERDGLLVDADFRVVGVLVRDQRFTAGRWSVGLGARTDVIMDGSLVAHAALEPYIVVDDGRVHSINGQPYFVMPIQLLQQAG